MKRRSTFVVACGVAGGLFIAAPCSAFSALEDEARGTSLDRPPPTGGAATALTDRTTPGVARDRTEGVILAQGGCLWDNGETNGDNGYSNATVDVFGARRTLLDDFELSQTSFLEDFHWLHIWNAMQPGNGTGLELDIRLDADGAPGVPIATATITSFSENATGRSWFGRPEALASVTFDPIALPPGRYWFEATIVGAQLDNDFWMITGNGIFNLSPCWVNYDDFGGLQPGNVVFGVDADLSWCLTGRVGATGACCLGFDCIDNFTREQCAARGGRYQGDGTNCNIVRCFGACCFPDGSCEDGTIPEVCQEIGGQYQGDGTFCEEIICPRPGACCISETECLDGLTPDQCAARGGEYQGDNTLCAEINCSQRGACCLNRGQDCIITTPQHCAFLQGFYLGNGSECETRIREPIHTADEWSHTIRIVSNCPRICDDCEDGFVERCGGTDECMDCLTPDGECLCVFGANVSCDQFQPCPDGNCPSGFFCCMNTCCPEPVCMPLCDIDAPEFEEAAIGEPTPAGIRGERGNGCLDGPYHVDPWITGDGSGGENCEDFGIVCPIPADFFGPGSDPFDGIVCFRGVPIGDIDLPGFGLVNFGDADTLVRREVDPFDRCELPSAETRGVDIEIIALNLVSIEPIVVTFNGGQDPEEWDVRLMVDPSQQPGGMLAATKEHCNGGTFDSVLGVCPKFEFVQVDTGQRETLDDCATCNPEGIVMRSDDIPWVTDPGGNLELPNPICSDFHAGAEDENPTTDCDCNENGVHDDALCDIPGDVNGNGCVDFGDILDILGRWGGGAGFGDVNCDGRVDFSDILEVLGHWGQGC